MPRSGPGDASSGGGGGGWGVDCAAVEATFIENASYEIF